MTDESNVTVLPLPAESVVEEAPSVTAPLYVWLPVVLIVIVGAPVIVMAPVVERLARPLTGPSKYVAPALLVVKANAPLTVDPNAMLPLEPVVVSAVLAVSTTAFPNVCVPLVLIDPPAKLVMPLTPMVSRLDNDRVGA